MKEVNYMNNEMAINTEDIYKMISSMILDTKENIRYNLNSEMVILYWNIGRKIKEEVLLENRAEYGQEVVKELSVKLKAEYGRGFSERNIANMIKFYIVFNDEKILQTLSAKLSWSHFVELIRIEDNIKMEFYVAMIVNERWSVRVLKERINSMLYERTVLSKKPAKTIENDIKSLITTGNMSMDLFLRDPYILDFLELQDTYSEKDLEKAILLELESFMLEFGREFTFVGRQIRITIGDRDYYIDLLFYHRKLKRLVLIELKLGEFKPEYKGQVELYLRWLNKNERNDGEESPIGIILCAEKSQETVELLELDKSGIHVAQYLTQLPPKEELEKKLHKAIKRAKSKLIEG